VNRQAFRFFHRLRVRWAEVDMQKIVFNGHYLMYFDTAVGDYWRALALPYEATMAQLGGDLYVKKAGVEYHASARYDDQLDIGMKCARIGNSSLVFQAAIFRGDSLLVTGELIYVYANPATQTSQPVPDSLRQIMTGFEAGEPVTQLRTGAWAALHVDAAPLRTAVFVEEQGVPADMEWDADDATALHAVSYNRLGVPVATGRLLASDRGVAHIGRMAVTRLLRGGGFGREVLRALVAAAQARGDREVRLHAQRSAEGFYRREGFVPHGENIEEAGIPHVVMMLSLSR
jgi:YbgC/YbaW family acyl-CoA thioester hydrolase